MSKFGEIINTSVPVLIDFFADWDDTAETMHQTLKDVAAAMGDKAKIVKIDVEKNRPLAEALRIKNNPTLILYKNGQMLWRQTGSMDANSLINVMLEFSM